MALNYACAGGSGRIMDTQIVRNEQDNISQSLLAQLETPITSRQ